MSARVWILDEKFEPVAHRQHISFIIDNGRSPLKKVASKEEISLSLCQFNLWTLSISAVIHAWYLFTTRAFLVTIEVIA